MLAIELATAAAKIILTGVKDGAVNEAGSQLFELVKRKLQGVFELDTAQENPPQLEAVILDAVSEDRTFRENLEQLVLSYQKQEQNQIIQNNKYGPNINNAHNNTFIGQQNVDKRNFRN